MLFAALLYEVGGGSKLDPPDTVRGLLQHANDEQARGT